MNRDVVVAPNEERTRRDRAASRDLTVSSSSSKMGRIFSATHVRFASTDTNNECDDIKLAKPPDAKKPKKGIQKKKSPSPPHSKDITMLSASQSIQEIRLMLHPRLAMESVASLSPNNANVSDYASWIHSATRARVWGTCSGRTETRSTRTVGTSSSAPSRSTASILYHSLYETETVAKRPHVGTV